MEPVASSSHNVSALGSVSFAWLHEHGGFRVDEPFFMDPRVRFEREQGMQRLVAEHFPNEPLYSFEGSLVQLEGRREPVMLVGAIQPNLLIGAAVGAKFVFYGDKDLDITPAPLAEIADLGALWRINWAETWPISALLEQVHAMRAAAPAGCRVVPPLFWDTTGRVTIHGLLTTAHKLLGERIFIEMMDAPEFVREFMAWLAAGYRELIRLFSAAGGLPVTSLHVGECSLCMIGPQQFTDFILPPMNELAKGLGPVRLHSCGHSDHLLEAFGQVAGLNCLNVGSGTSVAGIRERFGPVRVDLIPPAQLLSFADPRAVDEWVRRTVSENGGGRLEFQYHLDYGQPEANVLQISRTLRELGVPVGREPMPLGTEAA